MLVHAFYRAVTHRAATVRKRHLNRAATVKGRGLVNRATFVYRGEEQTRRYHGDR